MRPWARWCLNHNLIWLLWSDGTWCYRADLHTMTHMSDDYIVYAPI